MALILKKIISGYHYVNDELSDPRTKDYFLISSPFPGLALVIFYVYFVKVMGPRFMKERKPFQLDRIIMLYNVTQILANLYLFERSVTLAWGGTYNWYCAALDRSYSPHALQVTRTIHLYFLVKVVDLLDTIFFILRKKDGQVSFLHVYHHAGMVMASWGGVKYTPSGHVTFIGFLNTFVHVIMYTYYFITSMNPEYKKYIWWKKYITQLQMVQFLAIVIHVSQLLYANTCGYPTFVVAVLLPQNLFMLVLFSDFYRKTYHKKKE